MATVYKQGLLTQSKKRIPQGCEVKIAIENLYEKGSVAKYQQIMADLKTVDVSTDRDFQRRFNGFYRMRQRKPEYYHCFFSYLEEHKNESIGYKDVLEYLEKKAVEHFLKTRIETSFASKLLATIDPNQPIIDKNILDFHGIRLPYSSDTTRKDTIIQLHSELQQKMIAYSESSEGKEAICLFDLKFPNNTITEIKKIDFIIWETQK